MPSTHTRSERNRLWLVSLVFFLLAACAGEQPAENNKPAANPATEKPANTPKAEKPQKLKRPRLSNKNCVEWLLKYGAENPENKVKITTRYGDIVVKLYDDTPIHRANFIMLVKDGYFFETLFHRVEKGFIAQGGKGGDLHEGLRKGYGEYLLPANFEVPHFHKRGALAAARRYDDNPEMRSSPFDYYLVQGSVASPIYLDSLELRNSYTFTPHQREVYTALGGAPHLDGRHTVFGEIVEGLDVLDKLCNAETDSGWWPKDDIFVEMELVD